MDTAFKPSAPYCKQFEQYITTAKLTLASANEIAKSLESFKADLAKLLHPRMPKSSERRVHALCMRWNILPQKLYDAFVIGDPSLVSNLNELSSSAASGYTFDDILAVLRENAQRGKEWPPGTTRKLTKFDVRATWLVLANRKPRERSPTRKSGRSRGSEESRTDSEVSFEGPGVGRERSEVPLASLTGEFEAPEVIGPKAPGFDIQHSQNRAKPSHSDAKEVENVQESEKNLPIGPVPVSRNLSRILKLLGRELWDRWNAEDRKLKQARFEFGPSLWRFRMEIERCTKEFEDSLSMQKGYDGRGLGPQVHEPLTEVHYQFDGRGAFELHQAMFRRIEEASVETTKAQEKVREAISTLEKEKGGYEAMIRLRQALFEAPSSPGN
ncbi:hypothetical protein B0T19DRAFT_115702 [Cercophora scortea]|uniref:Uncharacterized protein n=1 Tax=Cercophora scortea TaxID=314031 RepID=A0AAE0MIM9_9PEZI|nr:hypothetical protein B0T19DRAFT_115702 [Cercophora scortea]